MRLGERAEAAGEADLGVVVVDVGVPEDQGLVDVQGLTDLGDGGVAEVAAEVQAPDLGADARTKFAEIESGFGSCRHGLVSFDLWVGG